MSDPDVIRMLGRLEKAVEDGQKETKRQLEEIRQKQADQGIAIARLGESHEDLERRILRAETMATSASKVANDSAAELNSTFGAIARHVEDAIRPLRANDHAQNTELASIRAMIVEQSDKSLAHAKSSNQRLGIYAGVIIALVPLAIRLLDWLIK